MRCESQRISALAAFLALFLDPGPGSVVEGASLRVPGDYATVGAAVSGAAENDTVLVAAGLYAETVSGRRGIVLLGGWSADFSRRDPAAWPSIVDAAGHETGVFDFRGSTGFLVVIDGFVIRNGWYDSGNGGGLLVHGKIAAEIRNNQFINNYARFHGGGICFFQGAHGLVENNLFEGNSAVFHGGGVALLDDVQAEIRGNVFRRNLVVFDSGAGVAVLKGCEVDIRANRFEENEARMRGAAVSFLQDITGVLDRNLMVHNSCGYKGGVIYSWKSAISCSNNSLVRNYSALTGGIRLDQSGTADLKSNLILRSPGAWLYRDGAVDVVHSGNLVWGCSGSEGMEGAAEPTSSDPQLCEEITDQRPRAGSPCLDGDGIGCFLSICGVPPGQDEPPLEWAGPK